MHQEIGSPLQCFYIRDGAAFSFSIKIGEYISGNTSRGARIFSESLVLTLQRADRLHKVILNNLFAWPIHVQNTCTTTSPSWGCKT